MTPTGGRPPSVPVGVAELLFVALSHVLDHLDEFDTYPHGMVLNMRHVLKAYDRDRLQALKIAGISEEASKRYTATSAEKLAEWLDSKALKDEQSDTHFTAWLEELRDGAEDDS